MQEGLEKTKQHNFVVIDCETGGIDKKNNLHAINRPITSIALMCLSAIDLSELSRYETFIKGKREPGFMPQSEEIVAGYVGYGMTHVYEKQALKHTNITIELLEEKGLNAKEACMKIIEFFESCNSGSANKKLILVGHNVVYDIPFLCFLFKECKKDLSKYVAGYYDHVGTFTPIFFDTMFLSRAKSSSSDDKHSLGDVIVREGFELADAHTAMQDVIATSEIFKKYILQLRSNASGEVILQEKFRDNFKFEY